MFWSCPFKIRHNEWIRTLHCPSAPLTVTDFQCFCFKAHKNCSNETVCRGKLFLFTSSTYDKGHGSTLKGSKTFQTPSHHHTAAPFPSAHTAVMSHCPVLFVLQSRVIFQQSGERSFHSFYQVNMLVCLHMCVCVCMQTYYFVCVRLNRPAGKMNPCSICESSTGILFLRIGVYGGENEVTVCVGC